MRFTLSRVPAQAEMLKKTAVYESSFPSALAAPSASRDSESNHDNIATVANARIPFLILPSHNQSFQGTPLRCCRTQTPANNAKWQIRKMSRTGRFQSMNG